MKFLDHIPRWMVIQTDLVVCGLSLILSYFLRYNFSVPPERWPAIWIAFITVIIIKLGAILFTKSYAGIIKYTSVQDAKKIFYTGLISAISIFIIDFIITRVLDIYFIPFGVILIDFVLSVFLMASFRVLAKILYYESKSNSLVRTNVVIYGAGEAGRITLRTMLQNKDLNYHVVGFVDDDPAKRKSYLEGIKIYNFEDLVEMCENDGVDLVVIAIQKLNHKRKQKVIDRCLAHDVDVRIIPPVRTWINGELSIKQIKEVSIDDLLGRPEIDLDNPKINTFLQNKVILITGAAGSIGSELVRQVSKASPRNIVLYDQAETPLYEIENELLTYPYKINYDVVVGDVTNNERLKWVFKTFKPDIVFHAAAYKHVPLMELNATEAIGVNVNGTKLMADMSSFYQVEKFVLVSTDKAVNPTNVMGASKRVAEIYCQSLNNLESNKTKFIITRFGNVLGSNGSVIPRFKSQIEKGGPVTITHPEITRYFMTIPEAVQLVLEASVMGNGGETFLFDMGEPIKILDLAKKMIALSGLKLGTDIQIVFSGLRPGEKLFEELLADPDKTLKTHHPKIMIGEPEKEDYEDVKVKVDELVMLIYTQDINQIVRKIKEIVPEYKSQNSQFEDLDNNQKSKVA